MIVKRTKSGKVSLELEQQSVQMLDYLFGVLISEPVSNKLTTNIDLSERIHFALLKDFYLKNIRKFKVVASVEKFTLTEPEALSLMLAIAEVDELLNIKMALHKVLI